ncbi:DExH-box ATP-dependent RNA helicase DExH6-like [Abrus precatorius]|uniref:RNA helicase n=1 Tax=Abrus precatorius TaxID=3816 RepID=A0A8B8KJG2_ABRPR|nr:DExH-box ATP-dependent RNA helicase DExH6-like [Abrus precatorius]
MANIDEAGPSQQLPNSFDNEPSEALMEKTSKILNHFVASKDQVYKFDGNLSGEERSAVDRLCHLMGLGVRFCGTGDELKICVYKVENGAPDQVQVITSRKRKRREEPESCSHRKAINVEFNRISQALENFLASNNEVYNFETKLSHQECQLVSQLCEKMGFKYTLSWHGIKQQVSIRKTKKVVDNTTLSEILPHVTCSEVSDQGDMLKNSQKEEEPEPPQHQDNIDIESKRALFSQILEKFLASEDKVYNFEDELSTKERALVVKLSQKMGLNWRFSGRGIRKKASVHKTKKEVDTTKKQKKLGPPQPKKLKRTQIFQALENFLASKDEVYKFEANLSPEECVAVNQLSQKMGLRVENSGSWIKHKVSVHKIKEEIHATTESENLPCFTFSEESKKVLCGSSPCYEHRGEMIGKYGDTTYSTESKEDDIFSRPCMSKHEITKKLENLSAKMKNLPDLKLISEKKSKLPIASFKGVITSTVESHQVVIICGETGCGKTTQVPQYILDHMWGNGEVCKIVCAQPRRIYVTSVSERISTERGENIGQSVGYKMQLESRGGRQSSIVLCTTGVLLKFLVSKGSHIFKRQSAKDDISSISHIIMDEIHERDRYSDVMLAILREMLPSNPHLRLILMSANVDAARFSQYFGVCPIIYVPGFTYPVKTYYLEDVLSIVKSGADNHLDDNHELSEEEKLSLDEAINLALYNDEWCSLLEFVSSKASPKVLNYQHSLTGLSPLMVFAGKGKVGDMCMLLSLGAKCHLRGKDGLTALEIAEKGNHQEAAELLKKHMDNDFCNNKRNNLLDKNFATVNPKVIDVVLIEQLIIKICVDSQDGGILVLLPGRDEITRTRERLLASPFFGNTSKFRVISLHSMARSIKQRKVYMCATSAYRKIVLSTNIAETAVSIDDIVYVIDTGLVKEKSYEPYSNVLTLQSSWISKASASQREALAGHCQPGVCYHLYSKVQAASLPDFQVPEIKRMPIEELCLQVKLLDPSCKIEEFLSRTLDPPGVESIQNAVGVLKEIGALSVGEQLTQLGKKLGSLAVPLSTSRMLLFSILTNCLDPALTLACVSEYKDPFKHPLLPDEKEIAAAARSEFASLYGGCGDQFAVIAAFECWQNSKRMGLDSRFCYQYFVSPKTMFILLGMRRKLAAELSRNGLIHNDISYYCSNAHDPGILQAVLVAWMYPNVGKLLLPNERAKKYIVKTKSGDNVRLNSLSLNSKFSFKKGYDCSLVVHDEITCSDWGMCIRNCTVVGLLPFFLLSKEIAVTPAMDYKEGDEVISSPDNIVRVTVDRWLDFESTILDASQIFYLRERLSAAILSKVTHSKHFLPTDLRVAMDALACVLSCDGLSGIPQTSACVNTLTTTINATDPEGFQIELTNQDAHKTNPSKVNESASEAIENPNKQTCQNAPIDLACSISMKQTDKNPEGSPTKLINHDDMPSSRPSISTSKGAENPCDPPNQSTAIGSACSIQPAHINDVATMIDVSSPKDSRSASKCLENPNRVRWSSSKGGCYRMVAVGWTFPEVGWMKANTDGSYKEREYLAASGGVFRDDTGSWCFGFVQNHGVICGSSDEAKAIGNYGITLSELWGILAALKLARERGISQLWVETDCAIALEFVLNRSGLNIDVLAPVVQSILDEMMKEDCTVRLSHCYREGNKVADWLAHYAQSTELGLHVLRAPPPDCVKFVKNDISGVFKLRAVRAGSRADLKV